MVIIPDGLVSDLGEDILFYTLNKTQATRTVLTACKILGCFMGL